MSRATAEGLTAERIEKPDSALAWIRPETVFLTDFKSGIDLGVGFRLIDYPGFFGFPKGTLSSSLHITANHLGGGLGVDIGKLLGRPELSLIQATIGGDYAHRWRSNDNGPAMYVSVSKLF